MSNIRQKQRDTTIVNSDNTFKAEDERGAGTTLVGSLPSPAELNFVK